MLYYTNYIASVESALMMPSVASVHCYLLIYLIGASAGSWCAGFPGLPGELRCARTVFNTS